MNAQDLKDELNRRIDEVVTHGNALSEDDVEQLDAAIPSIGEVIEELEEDEAEEAEEAERAEDITGTEV